MGCGVCVLVAAALAGGALAGNPDAKRLYDDLLSNYNKLVRPVVNTTDVLRVCIKLKLSQLIDVNLKNQIMTTNLWVEQSWYDYKLRWEPKEYGGVHMLHVPSDHIWRPDIVLYNKRVEEGNEVTMWRYRSAGPVIWSFRRVAGAAHAIRIPESATLERGFHASVMNTFGQVVGTVGTKFSSLFENIFFDVSHALEDESTAEEWRKHPNVNKPNQVQQENDNVTVQVTVSKTETADPKNPSVEKETQNTNLTVTNVTPEKVDTIKIDQILTSQAQAALTSNMLLNKIIEESGNDKCNLSKIIKKVYTVPSNNNNTIEIAEVDKICYTTEIKPHNTSTNSDQQTNATRSNPSEKVKIKELSVESGSYSSSNSGSYSGSTSYSDSVSLEVNDNDKKNHEDLLNQVAQLSQTRKSTENNVHLITKLDIVNQMEPYIAKSIAKNRKQGNDKSSNSADNINQKNANAFAQNDEKQIPIPHVKGDKNNETTSNSLISNELNNTVKGKDITAIPMPIMFKSKFENPINITTDKPTNSTESSADSTVPSTDSTRTISNHLKNETVGKNIATQAVNLKSVQNSDSKLNFDDKLDLKQSNNKGEIKNMRPVEGVKVGIELQSSGNTPVKNISNKTNHNAESESLNSTSEKNLLKSVATVIAENQETPRYAKKINETNNTKKNAQRTDIESTHLSDTSNKKLLHLPTQQTENKKKESIKIKNNLFSVVANQSSPQTPNVKAIHNEDKGIRADTSAAKAVDANNDTEKHHQSYSNTFFRLEDNGPLKVEHENVPSNKTDTTLLEPLALKIDEDPIEDNKPIDSVTSSDKTNVGNDKKGEADKQKDENPENENKLQDNGINQKESIAEDMKDTNRYSNKDSARSQLPDMNVEKLSNESSDHGQPSILPENDYVGPDKNTESDKTDMDIQTDVINNDKSNQSNQINEENFENKKKKSNEETSVMKTYPEDISEKKKLNDKLDAKIISGLRPDSKAKSTKLNNVIAENEETNNAEKFIKYNGDDNEVNRTVGGSSLDTNKSRTQNNIPSISDVNTDEGTSDLDDNSEYKVGDNENTNDEVENIADTSKDIPASRNPIDYDTISDMGTAADQSTDGLPNLDTREVPNNEEISDAENNFQDQLDIQNNDDVIANKQDQDTAKALSTLDNADTDTSKDIPDNHNPVDYDTISEMGTAADQSTDGFPNLDTGEVANNEEISDAASNFQDQLDRKNNDDIIANKQDQDTAEALSTLDNDDIDDQNTTNVKEGHSDNERGNKHSANIGKNENTDRVANNPSDKVDKNNEIDIKTSDLENNYRDKTENSNDESSIPADPPVSVDDLNENDDIDSEPNAEEPDGETTNSLDDDQTSFANNKETNDAEGDDDENYQDSS